VATKNVLITFIDHSEDVNSVRFHPDGTCIASGSDDKKIKIWDTRSNRLIQHYDAHSAAVSSISFHPSGNYLLSTGLDGLIKIWDLKLGQIIYTLHGHEGPSTAASFSNCGDFFATGGVDSILMVWKSNMKSMNEEFEALNKKEASYMKSNKSMFESILHGDENLEKFKASSGVSKKSKYAVLKSSDNEQATNNNNANKKMSKENTINTDDQFQKLPPELTSTFNKMIFQMDHIVK
jgi:WD40 repeat protein